MKIFKSLDEKFKEIGFNKVEDNKYGATYERYNKKNNYTQVLAVLHKKNGRHIIQSYDKNLMDIKGIGNTCVGLTVYEMKLAYKKARQKGYKCDKYACANQ